MNRRHCSGIAFFLWIAVSAHGTTAAMGGALRGVTRDSAGRLLGGVEVLAVADAGIVPLATTKSDELGRFLFEGLVPAVYRLTAFKEGYRSAAGTVDTGIRSTLDFVLRPAASGEDGSATTAPDDRSWILRLPNRGPLRDLDDGTTTAATIATGTNTAGTSAPGHAVVAPARASDGRLSEAISGRVDQLFTLGDSPADSGTASLRQGTETRVELAGTVKGWGKARLAGRRESLEGADELAAGGPSVGRRGSDVVLDVQLDPTAASTLSVTGYYAAREGQAPAAAQGWGSSERSWGWDARWSASLDGVSRVDVGVEYDDTRSNALALGGALGSLPMGAAQAPESRRTAAAGGRYERVAGDSHRLQFDLWAGLRDAAASVSSLAPLRTRRVAPWNDTWNVNMRAEDAWELSSQVGLIHGVGVFRLTSPLGAVPVLVPKVGAVVRADGATLRADASYFARFSESGWSGNPSALATSGSIGYSAEAAVPLPFGASFRAGVSSTPLLLGDSAGPYVESAASDAFVTDGLAARREMTAAVERSSARLTVHAAQAVGQVQGHVAPSPFFGGPATPLSIGSIAYRTTRLGVRFPGPGTDITLRYRWSAGPEGSVAERDLIEAQLTQDLMPLRLTDMSWRFLLVARSARERAPSNVAASTADSNNRARELSAGFAVAF